MKHSLSVLTVVGFDFLVLICGHILRSKTKTVHHLMPNILFCRNCCEKHSLNSDNETERMRRPDTYIFLATH